MPYVTSILVSFVIMAHNYIVSLPPLSPWHALFSVIVLLGASRSPQHMIPSLYCCGSFPYRLQCFSRSRHFCCSEAIKNLEPCPSVQSSNQVIPHPLTTIFFSSGQAKFSFGSSIQDTFSFSSTVLLRTTIEKSLKSSVGSM